MKLKSSLLTLLICLSFSVFGQNENLDKELDQAIEQMVKELESLDFAKIFNEDILSKIEEIKPSDDQLNEMQEQLGQGLNALQKIDFSQFEKLFKEFENVFEGMDLPGIQKQNNNQKKPAQKGKRI